jgi:hypothetical protein
VDRSKLDLPPAVAGNLQEGRRLRITTARVTDLEVRSERRLGADFRPQQLRLLIMPVLRSRSARDPISVPADHLDFDARLKTSESDALHVVNMFRLGHPSKPGAARHFRLPVARLIV